MNSGHSGTTGIGSIFSGNSPESACQREHAKQQGPRPLAEPQDRRHPNDRDQREAKGQPECGRLPPRKRPLPRAAAGDEDYKMDQATDQQEHADHIGRALFLPSDF